MFPSVSPAWHWPVNWISDRSKERSSAWRTSLLLSRPSRRPAGLREGMSGRLVQPKHGLHQRPGIISNLLNEPGRFFSRSPDPNHGEYARTTREQEERENGEARERFAASQHK